MKPVAYMIWAPFTGPAQFTTDHSAPEKTAQRADYTCTPLVTEQDALAAIEQARREAEIATWAKAGAQRNLDVEQARREAFEEAAKIADEAYECCRNYVVGGTYMGDQERICCGEPRGREPHEIAAAIRARGEAPTWTADQVSQVNDEADRLAAKFAQSQKPLPQDIAQVLSDASDALVERGEGK